MNKPSERIVVFVTPAQKRAITASAEELGISVSELMRRAVLSFGATSERVKAAGIVDRMRAPREPDALNEALERVARGTRDAQAALPSLLKKGAPAAAAGEAQAAHEPLLPADVLAALVRTPEEEQAMADEEAVARVAAAKAATIAPQPQTQSRTDAPPFVAPAAPVAPVAPRRRVRIDTTPDEDDPRNDPAAEDGRFA
jgi:hypothetical protein